MAGLLDKSKYAVYYKRLEVIYKRPEIKASLEIILSVFMVAILIFLAVRPTLSNIAGLQKKIEDIEKMDLKADSKIAQLFNARAQLDQYQNKLNLFERAVGNKMSYYEIAARIEALSRRNGLELADMNFPGSLVAGKTKPASEWATKILQKDPAGFEQVEVNITIYGTPDGMRSFLSDIEKMDKLAMINSLVINRESGPTKGSERIKMNLRIFFYNIPE